jgi:2',3'-cyclic-nucleotide 2'-phosphodiesterase/3'-nucleotidase
VADGDRFVLAVNNYRANGGGNFPHIASACRVWADSEEVRNTIVSWVRANGEIDPARFASADWRLVREGFRSSGDPGTARRGPVRSGAGHSP